MSARILSAGAGELAPFFEEIFLTGGERIARPYPRQKMWDFEDLAREIVKSIDEDGIPIGWISYRPLSSLWASPPLYQRLEWLRSRDGRETVDIIAANVPDLAIHAIKGRATDELRQYVTEHGKGFLFAPDGEFIAGWLVSVKGKALLLDDVQREFHKACDWLEYVKIVPRKKATK